MQGRAGALAQGRFAERFDVSLHRSAFRRTVRHFADQPLSQARFAERGIGPVRCCGVAVLHSFAWGGVARAVLHRFAMHGQRPPSKAMQHRTGFAPQAKRCTCFAPQAKR
jgi:hypothetical protein